MFLTLLQPIGNSKWSVSFFKTGKRSQRMLQKTSTHTSSFRSIPIHWSITFSKKLLFLTCSCIISSSQSQECLCLWEKGNSTSSNGKDFSRICSSWSWAAVLRKWEAKPSSCFACVTRWPRCSRSRSRWAKWTKANWYKTIRQCWMT